MPAADDPANSCAPIVARRAAAGRLEGVPDFLDGPAAGDG
jgi:hypothetical protein